MKDIHTCFDREGNFYASVISKKGRNEVQIFPIDKSDAKSIVKASQVSRFELDPNDIVKSVCWAYDESHTADRRKRKSDNAQTDINTSQSSRLVVSLGSGAIQVFNPSSSALPSTSFGSSKEDSSNIVSITHSWRNPSVWTLQKDSNVLTEVSVSTGKVLKTFKFDEEKKCSIVSSLEIASNTAAKTAQHLLIGGEESLYLIDPSKPKKSLLMKYIDVSQKISKISQSRSNPDIFAVISDGEPTVKLYSHSQNRHIAILKTSSAVENIYFTGTEEGEVDILLAVSQKGDIQAFTTQVKSDSDISSQPISIIRANLDTIKFKDVTKIAGNKILAVWYDKNEPKFQLINWSSAREGEIIVNIEGKENGNDDEETLVNDEQDYDLDYYRKQTDIKNVSVDELSAKLSTLLSSESPKERENVIELCSQNNNEVNIKNTIKLLSTNGASQPVKDLFEIISTEVSSQPRRTQTLAIWLKWLLLTHGGYIANQSDQRQNLTNLQKGLASGLKLMPKLLSLQGRLNLLKSQMELRNSIPRDEDDGDNERGNKTYGEADYTADGEEDNTTINETEMTVNGEESIVYANGENDDFQQILEDEQGDFEDEEEDDEAGDEDDADEHEGQDENGVDGIEDDDDEADE